MPAAQADPVQFAASRSAVTTYWPVVHAVAGLAVIPVRAARLAGVVAPVGVKNPGAPAVAPVAVTPAVDRVGGAVMIQSMSTSEAAPASPPNIVYGWGITNPENWGLVADTDRDAYGLTLNGQGVPDD